MTRVLFVGQQPETVDFTDPVLPPGMNAERINAGIALALKQMAERGWHADLCLLRPDETAGPEVERRLKVQAYDCVVIGAGIRLLSHHLPMFEAVINAVHRAAPGAAIAFNTHPEDSADAAARADKIRAQPDAEAKTIALSKVDAWKRGDEFPKEFVTLPGRAYPSSALIYACSTLLLTPKSAALQ